MNWARWMALLAAFVGVTLGLAYSWVIAPPPLSASSPEALRADFRDQYRFAIAAAYASTGDLPRARARLILLGDVDPVEALTAQAQRMLASGQSFDGARQLALLASDLQAGASSIKAGALVRPPALTGGPATSPSDGASGPTPGLTSSPSGTEATPSTAIAPSPVSTPTPFASPSSPFKLISRQDVCEPNSPAGQLRLTILDRAGQPMPGMEITITWANGEERFFTGLQPEINPGYADFAMQPGTTYALRVARVGAPISALSAPACPPSQEGSLGFTGGLELTLQEP